MAEDKKKDQSSTLVKWIAWIVAGTVILLGVALFIRLVIVPACKQASVQQNAVQRTNAAKNSVQSTSKCEVFILHPGQGKTLVTNYKNVEWKISGGPALVRERDQAWYGRWKKDLPGVGTQFDDSKAHAIEFWVPKNFPASVTIAVERS